MVIECLAIFGIIFAISIIFLRSKRKDYAATTLPLLILPSANILISIFSGSIAKLPFGQLTTIMFINIAAALISCVIVGVASLKFSKKHTGITYIVICILFNVLLATILLHHHIERLT